MTKIPTVRLARNTYYMLLLLHRRAVVLSGEKLLLFAFHPEGCGMSLEQLVYSHGGDALYLQRSSSHSLRSPCCRAIDRNDSISRRYHPRCCWWRW